MVEQRIDIVVVGATFGDDLVYASFKEVELLDQLRADFAFLVDMVEIVDGDVAQLTAEADNRSLIRHVVVQAKRSDCCLARELGIERELLHHADLYA